MSIKSPKRGAFPSPRHELAAATPHIARIGAPTEFIMVPQHISMWGNDVHGDCVTAEEAFAKACNVPEIFIPDNEVVAWASQRGVLEGAYLTQIMRMMQYDGLGLDTTLYDDGNYHSVNWTNSSILQSAIYTGPVKIGIAANQVETAWRTTGGQTGWFGVGFKNDSAQDHCVSLCGYGTLSWLAQTLGVQVPATIDGSQQGYTMFTWNSIGIIDEPSLVAITHEAWVRMPTTTKANLKRATLQALGGERGKYLSHAHSNVGLQNGVQGEGEVFVLVSYPNGCVALACQGGENGKYLSHARSQVCLQTSVQGDGELWNCYDLGSNNVAFQCIGAETGKYLSHANNNVWLQNGCRGAGEWWAQA